MGGSEVTLSSVASKNSECSYGYYTNCDSNLSAWVDNRQSLLGVVELVILLLTEEYNEQGVAQLE